jgi:uncharacterized protein YukE
VKNDPNVSLADQDHWYPELGIANSIADITSTVESESWVEAGIGTFAHAAKTATWATDPFGQLLQYNVSWLMEHLKPLRDTLDWLAGDPPQIEAYAQTWWNVSKAVNITATDLLDRSRDNTETWHGTAADAYRSHAKALAQAVADTAKTAELIGTIVSIASKLVATVRELVRDLTAQLVGILLERAWEWATETAAGVAALGAQAQIAALIAKWCGKVARVVAELCRSLNNLKALTGRLDDIWNLLGKAWQRFREG